MRNTSAAFALAFAFLGMLIWAAPQVERPSADLPAPIRVDVEVVNVLCSVRDRNGALISNLGKDDFIVLEDGKEQEIRYFAKETDLPLTIGLLVDVSGSQENLIEVERRAAHQFFSSVLRKKDMAFLISFGTDSELLQDYTNSLPLLRAGLDRLRLKAAVGGLHPGPVPTAGTIRGTVLYDAVYLAATDRLVGEVGRKAMVLITDGVDVGSKVNLDTAIEFAQKADAIIYSIYYIDHSVYSGGGFGGFSPGDGAIKKMSEQTGGRLMKVDRKNSLDSIFEQIQAEMRSQYSIGYTPPSGDLDGGFHKLEVRTRDKKLKVQARKGYYAVKQERR
ncbi:MAG: VWA domain-containing protein [Bryobacteraceae bacterium]